ncbi:unnamed protein product [Allacma fusca]|uniref:Uncharacterized protein n=1 Tax=Allacma fusca TaxID=39272 RepID=A0A8J2J1V8_9HEXA|nr:unnamed protein product [Allacma fusca]
MGDQIMSQNTATEQKMSSEQVREMMANAQRMIEERKRQLQLANNLQMGQMTGPRPNLPQMIGGLGPRSTMRIHIPPVMSAEPDPGAAAAPLFDGDKARKLAELKEQINIKIASGMIKGKAATAEELAAPSKPVPLLLDNEGRAIDTAGKQLLFPTHQPTLKANIRAQKRAEFKQQTNEKPESMEFEQNKYFDDRLAPTSLKARNRGKVGLKFNEPGKYVSLAQRQRMQAQLARLQQEIADKARKTGISTAARLARLSGAVASSTDPKQEYIPKIEWWDSLLLEDKEKEQLGYDYPVDEINVTNLIEHPIQLRCPTEPTDPVYLPVFLTKKEQKKLRRQNRREAWKEKQEKVRLGLDPAPAPKVRISNLMRVLGVEAVQDPTKIEAHVRKQMALRLKTHQDANANRKLTPEQRKDKKIKKLKEDTTLGVHVTVYRVGDFSNQSKKFKVETNAKQLMLTGCILLYRECNVVIVEGGPKQQKKYKRLIMNRIKWSVDNVKGKEDTPNKVVMVWEGTTKQRAFQDMKFKIVQTEEQAREYFKKHGVQHFWDLALSGTVLENVTEGI